MKRKQLLTKTLLIAAMLFVGASVSWAGVSNVFSQASWSHTHPGAGQNGDRSSSLSFDGTSSIADNWTASFDVTTSSTNSRTNGTRNFQIALLSAAANSFPSNVVATTNVLLGARFQTVNNTDYSSFACTITVNDADEANTVTLNHGTKYTFSVTVSGTSMTVSIKNGNTSVFSKEATLGAFVKPKGIYDLLPRPYNASWGVYTNSYSDILVTKEVNVEEVTAPSIAVAYKGAKRTVTITPGESSESNVVTTYYTLNGEDPTSSDNVYSTPFDVDEDCTVKAISISSTSVASGIASQAVTVGKLKLAAPTFAKTAYSNGKYTVSMESNQSGLAYPPASYTHYYSIDGGDAVAYSTPFEVNAGSTVSGYVTATNYTNSDNSNTTPAVRPVLSEVWSIDFAGQATEDKGSVTVGDAAFTANSVNFSNISGSFTSNDNFGVKTGTSWMLRNTGSKGLYSFNGSNTPVGVQGLTSGQYIKMVVGAMSSCSGSGAVSYNSDMSTDTELYFVANDNGNAYIQLNRYIYIKSIAVCNIVTSVSKTIGEFGYATFSSTYALDFTNVDNAKAFIVTSKNNDGTAIVMQPVTGKIAAGTGLILKGTKGSVTNVTIPITSETGTYYNTTSDIKNYLFPINTDDYELKAATNGGTNYILTVQSEKVVFAPIGDISAIMNEGQAALWLPASTPARTLILSFGEEEITAINGISSNEPKASKNYYNLQGQRVSQPKHGIYVVEGKKVLVK